MISMSKIAVLERNAEELFSDDAPVLGKYSHDREAEIITEAIYEASRMLDNISRGKNPYVAVGSLYGEGGKKLHGKYDIGSDTIYLSEEAEADEGMKAYVAVHEAMHRVASRYDHGHPEEDVVSMTEFVLDHLQHDSNEKVAGLARKGYMVQGIDRLESFMNTPEGERYLKASEYSGLGTELLDGAMGIPKSIELGMRKIYNFGPAGFLKNYLGLDLGTEDKPNVSEWLKKFMKELGSVYAKASEERAQKRQQGQGQTI